MAEVPRHKPAVVLRGYVRCADLLHEQAGVAFL
jgi:hypothetical protein